MIDTKDSLTGGRAHGGGKRCQTVGSKPRVCVIPWVVAGTLSPRFARVTQTNSAGYVGEGRKAFLTLKNEILDPILLRRTKETRSQDIMLPPRLIKLRHDPMDEREEDFYQALYTQSQAQFNTYLEGGTVLNNYAHIFDILIRYVVGAWVVVSCSWDVPPWVSTSGHSHQTQSKTHKNSLRQAVDHPYLVIHSHSRTNTGVGAGTSGPTPAAKPQEDDEEEECVVCHEGVEDVVRAECGCGFCRLCVTEYLEAALGGVNQCPGCSQPLTVDLSKKEGEQEAEDATSGRGRATRNSGSNANTAGTVCVAGRLKVRLCVGECGAGSMSELIINSPHPPTPHPHSSKAWTARASCTASSWRTSRPAPSWKPCWRSCT